MSNELMIRDEALSPTTFDGLYKQAQAFVKSGLLPDAVKTPEAAILIVLKGRELGLPPVYSLSNINVIKGKPAVNAQTMGALILAKGHHYHPDVITNDRCVITFTRKGGKPYTHEFTMEDAKRAGLATLETWQKYPKALLFSRCMSAGARIVMPDVLAGMYTPEELTDSVTVDAETGEIVATHEDAPKSTVTVVTPGNGHAAQTEANAWTRTTGQLDKMAEHYALSNATILEALKVSKLEDYQGTKAQAKADIETWLDANVTEIEQEPDPMALQM